MKTKLKYSKLKLKQIMNDKESTNIKLTNAKDLGYKLAELFSQCSEVNNFRRAFSYARSNTNKLIWPFVLASFKIKLQYKHNK